MESATQSALPAVSAALRMGSALAWIPAAVLVVVVALVAAWPAGLLASAVWRLGWPDGSSGVRVVATVAVGYGVFVVLWPLVAGGARRLLRLRGRPGSMAVTSPYMFGWYAQLLLTYAGMSLVGRPVQAVGAMRWFARAMGMTIGPSSMLNTRNLYDMDLIHVGRGVLVGGDAYLVPHVVERGRLIRAPIHLGDGSSIGLQAVVLPGARVGRNCHVGAMSLVPKGAVLDDDAVYGGVPVRKLRDLSE